MIAETELPIPRITRPRKLAEVWLVPPHRASARWDVQLRVHVGDWSDDVAAEATLAAVRQFVAAADANTLELAADERLEPPGA